MFEIQNDNKSIELLIVMRFYYNKAKKVHRIRVLGNFIMALVAGYLVSYFPQIKLTLLWALPVLTGIWTLVSRLFLLDQEKEYVKIAAIIQEEFDTRLFDLPWHRSLVGNQIQSEVLKKAKRKFKGDLNKLKNWYVGQNAPTKTLNVLLAQRTNLVWDTTLRKRYAIIVAFLTVVYLGVTILVGYKIDLGTYILTFIIPSLSIFLHGIETSRDHWRRAASCERLGRDVKNAYEACGRDQSTNIQQTCREFQDFIFQKRCDINLVPNMLYWLSRDKDDDLMKSVNEEMSDCQMT